MTRIVFVISKMIVGGAERVLHDLAVGLGCNGMGYKATVVCLYEKGRIGDALSKKGIRLYERVLRNKFDLMGMLRFINILKKERPDILYISGETLTQAVGLAASRFLKIPAEVIAIHSHNLANRSAYKSFIDKISFNSVKNIICVSRSQKDHVVAARSVRPEKIKVIYNGIDVNRFNGIREKRPVAEFSVPETAIIIGTIASLRKEKGLDVLIKAMPELIRHCPDAYFLIAGNGKEKSVLEMMAKELGVYSHIRFLGEIGDVADVIPFFDIVCLSSRTENFPLAALECMACGKPVVATRVGGVPEMVQHGVNGILVEPGSPHDLAKGLLSLINDKGLRRETGIAARKTVEQNFTLDRMLERYREYFTLLSMTKV